MAPLLWVSTTTYEDSPRNTACFGPGERPGHGEAAIIAVWNRQIGGPIYHYQHHTEIGVAEDNHPTKW